MASSVCFIVADDYFGALVFRGKPLIGYAVFGVSNEDSTTPFISILVDARSFPRKTCVGIVGGMSDHYLSVKEVAQRANLSVNTVRSYARKGLLPHPAVTVGKVRGYRLEDIDRWIEERRPY